MHSRLLLPLLSFLLASSLFAQPTDLQISISTDKSIVKTGERFTATLLVKNAGPADAKEINLLMQPTAFLLGAQLPSGWSCPLPVLSCHSSSLSNGSEAQLVLTMLAPSNHESGNTFTLMANVHGEAADVNDQNNQTQTVLQLTHTDMIADLAVSFAKSSVQAREGTPVILNLNVTNHGPTAAETVLLVLQSSNHPVFVPLTVEGSGWTCANVGTRTECTHGRLASGAAAPLTIRMTAPSSEALLQFVAHAITEGNLDQKRDNDIAYAFITVGSAESWKRVLLPLAASDFRGANGSIWRTKTTMLLAGDPSDTFELRPHGCEYIVLHCFAFDVPVGRVFDPAEESQLQDPMGHNNGGSQFFYVRAQNERKLRVNSRVYDVSRETDTAGSEIPIAREHDFSADTISILGIPVRSQYRYTLRVYDFDALHGAQIALRVFADEETEPRATVTGTLRVSFPLVTTNARLPVRPAYLQLDPTTQIPSMEGIDSLRIDIEPLTPGLKIWAFVSVTDNDTHHVTTFSAQ